MCVCVCVCVHAQCYATDVRIRSLPWFSACTGDAGLRDYLCSWLCMLMVDQYHVVEEQDNGVEIVKSMSVLHSYQSLVAMV